MGNLFLVTRSPFSRRDALLALGLAEKDDVICFIQDGVYAAHHLPDELGIAIECAEQRGVQFSVLREDLEARGLAPSARFETIDYNDLVGLIINSRRTIA